MQQIKFLVGLFILFNNLMQEKNNPPTQKLIYMVNVVKNFYLL